MVFVEILVCLRVASDLGEEADWRGREVLVEGFEDLERGVNGCGGYPVVDKVNVIRLIASSAHELREVTDIYCTLEASRVNCVVNINRVAFVFLNESSL